MNYRHHFHAGNFADVMKHALLLQLVRALQKKDKGFVYLDTHAGRGRYDLQRAAVGTTQTRTPEWPDGIGRLWSLISSESLPEGVSEYLNLVRQFDRETGNLEATPRFYPGSPRLVRRVVRLQDRLALAEKQPDEAAALRAEFSGERAVTVQEMDGYTALRAMLPPPERRALVLIDPPFEAQDEFAQIGAALAEGLRRFPTAVYAVWYPLTERARVERFFTLVRELQPPPTLACELEIAGELSTIKMRGCGLLIINPPWKFDADAKPTLTFLAKALAHAPGGGARLEWIEPEG
jgi:23S rRNA (adenine2030-N6)-methyltransferase